MRLKLTQQEQPSHSSIVTCVGWTKAEKQYELLTEEGALEEEDHYPLRVTSEEKVLTS